jgi:uncharacterized OsmC-like protein
MSDIVNSINLDYWNATPEKIKNDPSLRKVKQSLTGNWNLVDEKMPQFSAILRSETGKEIQLYSDQPRSQGGRGSFPGPILYCLFGILSCFMATFATVAAIKGVTLKRFESTITAQVNLSTVFCLADEPILESVTIEVKVDSEPRSVDLIQNLIKEAEERCPAAYTLKHGTNLIVKLA